MLNIHQLTYPLSTTLVVCSFWSQNFYFASFIQQVRRLQGNFLFKVWTLWNIYFKLGSWNRNCIVSAGDQSQAPDVKMCLSLSWDQENSSIFPPHPHPHHSQSTRGTAQYRVELETKVKRRFVKVSIVSYSHPFLMIIALASQFHIYLPWVQRQFSIVS